MAGESAREVARKAREKAGRLERRAELFERGAEGETRTAAVLASLPGGWLTIHDVAWPSRRFANIDHVLIGPGGIFVIDSKNWSGRVTLDRGRLRQNGRSRERSVTGCAEASRAVAALAGPDAGKVFPVLCFTGQEGLTGRCGDVLVCSEDTLVQMLLSRPVLLDHAAAMDAWLRLDTQLRGAQLPLDRTVARPRVADALRAGAFRPRARRPRKKRPSLISALLGVMLLFGFAVVGPDLARNVGDVVADYMTRDLPEPQACGAPDVDRPGADRGDADRPKDDKRQRQGGKRQAKGDC